MTPLFDTPHPGSAHPLPQGERITTHGFTIIELLVVVLIIAILAAVALPQYNKTVEKARVAEAITILNALDKAQQACVLERTGEEECTGMAFWQNAIFEPPTALSEECLQTSPCLRLKNWEVSSEDGFYAWRIKNGEPTGAYLWQSDYFSKIWEDEPGIGCDDARDPGYCSSIGM